MEKAGIKNISASVQSFCAFSQVVKLMVLYKDRRELEHQDYEVKQTIYKVRKETYQ